MTRFLEPCFLLDALLRLPPALELPLTLDFFELRLPALDLARDFDFELRAFDLRDPALEVREPAREPARELARERGRAFDRDTREPPALE